jgi:NADH-quinone oxidoreductase subunit G
VPKLTIDGKEIEAPAGTNLIQAAESAGIEIPHYCYHPGLSVPGNCRMCLVEIEKSPKLQIACNTAVADNMVVHTDNDRVKSAHRAVLEFLLINHPIDCPVCDQAGECKLQDYYMDYDRQESRFPLGRKNHKGKAIDIGSGVMLDQERCILCARCTRFFDEITHTGELAIFERGDHNKIDCMPGHKVDNKYAGNVIDICPVGALTEKEFRFRARVWYLHRTPSVCDMCERGCSIDIYHLRNRIFRFKPRENPHVNGYWMCDEGRHSFPALQGETRLTMPLLQNGDHFAAESWETAIQRAASRIADAIKVGGSIGAVVGGHSTNEEAFALKRLMSVTFKSDLLGALNYTPPGSSGDDDLLIRANKNPNTRGLAAIGIEDKGLDRITSAIEAGQMKVLIAMRADLVRAFTEETFTQKFGALDYLLVLDTDANKTCQMANQVLPIAAYPELDGSFTNFTGRVQRLTRAFDPPGQALPAIEVLARIDAALGRNDVGRTAEAIFTALAANEPAFKGLAFEALGHLGADLAK